MSTTRRRQLVEVEREIRTVLAPDEDILTRVGDRLRELCGAELCVFYNLEVEGEHLRLARAHITGTLLSHAEIVTTLERATQRAPRGRWGIFDPGRPDPGQRNRAITPVVDGAVLPARDLQRLGVGRGGTEALETRVQAHRDSTPLQGLSQTRTLLCHGDSLLGWFGFLTSALNHREREQILDALIPALRDRIRLETWAELGRAGGEALAAMLEAMPTPAVLVTPSGRVVHTNSIARSLLDADCDSLRHEIATTLRGCGPLSRMHLAEAATAELMLLYRCPVSRREPLTDAQRMAAAAAQYGLTARQAETLLELSRGAANQRIARVMGCSRRTVEKHVAALMDKLEVSSRAALVARFWMLYP